MDDKYLIDAKAVLKALGKTKQVMTLTGAANYQTVGNWRVRGRFPSNLFLVMTTELKRLGYTADPKLWDQQQPDERAPHSEPALAAPS